MTSQFDFSNAEWSDIAALPILVGVAIARAEDSGRIGSWREIRVLVASFGDHPQDNEALSLIDAVATIEVKDKLDEFESHSPEVLADIAVRACTEVSKTLATRATPGEVTGYQTWVYDVAYSVANAATEHGVRVSEPEVALLSRLREALAIT